MVASYKYGMGFFFPILITSLIIVFFMVLFTFFPIRISWFYCIVRSARKPSPTKAAPRYPSLAVKNFRYNDEDDYDDKEL